jgi:hypothetical protein
MIREGEEDEDEDESWHITSHPSFLVVWDNTAIDVLPRLAGWLVLVLRCWYWG